MLLLVKIAKKTAGNNENYNSRYKIKWDGTVCEYYNVDLLATL